MTALATVPTQAVAQQAADDDQAVDYIALDPTGGRLVAWASALQAAHQIGKALCGTTFAPNHFRGKPDDAAAAILFGDELGLTPTQSLRSVFVIGGTPSLYARQMVAIVLSKGHRMWTETKTDSTVTVCGQRRGSDVVERETWTTARAHKAGYTSNKKYTTDPQAMLYARAASDIARRIAPDALAGISYSVEEMEMTEATTVTITPQNSGTGTRKVSRKPQPEPDLDDQTRAVEVAEAAVEDAPAPATRSDFGRLNRAFENAGITTKDAKLATARGVIQRDIAAATELTAAEVERVIEDLTKPADTLPVQEPEYYDPTAEQGWGAQGGESR